MSRARCRVWLAALPLLAAAGAAAADDPLLARYRGGELRQSQLHLAPEAFAELAGERRSAAICGAAYRTIYGELGARRGLEQSPEVAAALAAARRRLAAELFRRKRMPNFAGRLSAGEIEAEWRRRAAPGGDLYFPGQIDMDVLYVRCSVLPDERAACAARAAELDQRLKRGEPFIDLVAEERQRSGAANGSYSGTPLDRLSSDLRQLAENTPREGLSAWLEAPHGLFRLQVLGRRGAGPRPLPVVEAQVRQELAESRQQAWEEEERKRLDPRSKAPIEEVLAAAAEQAGDTRDKAFLAELEAQKRRLLAAAAFATDKASRPADAELEALRTARRGELEELVLLVFALPFGEPKAAYARAGEIAAALRAGEADLPAALAALPARFGELRVEQVGPLRRQVIAESLPEFAKSLEGAAAGTWRGPIPLATEGLWHLLRPAEEPAAGDLAAFDPVAGRSLAFVAVLQRSVPPLRQLRRELLGPKIEELENGGVYCRELLGRRYQLEILPDPDAGGPVR